MYSEIFYFIYTLIIGLKLLYIFRTVSNDIVNFQLQAKFFIESIEKDIRLLLRPSLSNARHQSRLVVAILLYISSITFMLLLKEWQTIFYFSTILIISKYMLFTVRSDRKRKYLYILWILLFYVTHLHFIINYWIK